MKKTLLVIMLLLPVSSYAECNTKGLAYKNCNAGQLIDICKNIAYWRKQIECCDKKSGYEIYDEIINTKELKEFYKNYMTKFDEEVYHCALRLGKIEE